MVELEILKDAVKSSRGDSGDLSSRLSQLRDAMRVDKKAA
jgi:hypothetical protein